VSALPDASDAMTSAPFPLPRAIRGPGDQRESTMLSVIAGFAEPL
jgi:hypothetical protein